MIIWLLYYITLLFLFVGVLSELLQRWCSEGIEPAAALPNRDNMLPHFTRIRFSAPASAWLLDEEGQHIHFNPYLSGGVIRRPEAVFGIAWPLELRFASPKACQA